MISLSEHIGLFDAEDSVLLQVHKRMAFMVPFGTSRSRSAKSRSLSSTETSMFIAYLEGGAEVMLLSSTSQVLGSGCTPLLEGVEGDEIFFFSETIRMCKLWYNIYKLYMGKNKKLNTW